MKLDEKLIKLRKEHGWSQEELADKLDVTRQTISKWELGQSMPDTENLSKIASLYGTSVNDLLDDNVTTTKAKISNDEGKGNKIKIALLVAILLVALIGVTSMIIGNSFIKSVTGGKGSKGLFEDIFNTTTSIMDKTLDTMDNTTNTITNTIDKATNTIDKASEEIDNGSEKIKESVDDIKKDNFNSNFETLYFGTKDGFFMTSFIDTVIKSNQKNPEKQIVVKYKDTEVSDNNELSNLKDNFKTGTDYEIMYEYDNDGYINKAIIK